MLSVLRCTGCSGRGRAEVQVFFDGLGNLSGSNLRVEETLRIHVP